MAGDHHVTEADLQQTELQAQIARDVAKFTRRSRRSLWLVVIAMAIVVIAVCVTAAFLVDRQVTEKKRIQEEVTQQATGLCQLLFDTGTSIPPYRVLIQSKASVKFRIDVRTAVANLNCPQKLPPPPPQLIQGAAHYGLRIPF